ncbi:transporter substrate-binding domain-containing protein [Devosia algicola]|uniref:Transporter substrate-binding domain-containing protein n=1 Tax=Devosia algicola TaxID=3026418 RepID=A0ABY7YMZ7_9HYPH|nr:transporter substrate-binding domain-containing protein [Devosia algicola]WDR02641.1 transporter substrate-binding domain-containing protein [Devosia algicola]
MLNTQKFGKTILAAIAVMAMGSASVSAASLADIQKSGKIRIAVANEIPYGYIDPNGDAKGAGPDVAKHIMDKLGIKDIEWVTAEFSGLIPGLQADRFDMVAAEMAVLPARCEQVIYSEPNTSYGEGLLVAAGNPDDIHSFDDFAKRKDIKVAIMAGADQARHDAGPWCCRGPDGDHFVQCRCHFHSIDRPRQCLCRHQPDRQ